MILYILVKAEMIPDTWEPHNIWYLFFFDVLFEVFILANLVFFIRGWLA